MQQGHVYTVGMQNVTIANAAVTLVIIHTAAALTTRASVIEILRVSVSQSTSETAEELGIQLGTKASAFGTYTSATPGPHFLGGCASGIAGGTAGAAATAGTNASAEGAGTFTVIPVGHDGFDNRNGYVWIPSEEEQIIVPNDVAFAVKFVAAPTSLNNWSAYITYRELN